MAKAQAKKAGANKSKAALKSRRSVKKASSRKVAPKKRSKSSEASRKAKKHAITGCMMRRRCIGPYSRSDRPLKKSDCKIT